jgi:DUF1016 N-terminal domain
LKKTKRVSIESVIARRKPRKGATPRRAAVTEVVADVDEAGLLADLRDLISAARRRVATVANATHSRLCWHVGRRLLRENLHEGRAAYGKRILATLSQQLTAEFGEGFSYSSLTRMVRFAEIMEDEEIIATLSQQLGWSHFQALLPIKDPRQRVPHRATLEKIAPEPTAPSHRARPRASRARASARRRSDAATQQGFKREEALDSAEETLSGSGVLRAIGIR